MFRNEASLAQPGHRYLTLVGCFFRTSEYIGFQRALEDLKQRHFPHNPDEPVVLHRKDILECRGPFARLRDPQARAAFDDELIALISSSQFKLVAVLVHKEELLQRYPTPFHPYHMALDFILQRYCGYLNHMGKQGDVMAESRGRTEDQRLRNAYSHILTHGDMHHGSEFYKRVLTSKELKLKPKTANIAGLQLADLLAHPMRQDVLIQCQREAGAVGSFAKRLASIAAAKYNRHLYGGRVEGYGWVLFPR